MFRAVLFDMDGVVIDTHQSVTHFWQAVAAEQNVTLTIDDFGENKGDGSGRIYFSSRFPLQKPGARNS